MPTVKDYERYMSEDYDERLDKRNRRSVKFVDVKKNPINRVRKAAALKKDEARGKEIVREDNIQPEI